MKKLLFILLSPFLLTACGPPLVFGIPQEQWDQLNQQQRSQVIAGYNQKKTAEAQVAPLFAVANALGEKNSHHHHRDPFHNFDTDPFSTQKNLEQPNLPF